MLNCFHAEQILLGKLAIAMNVKENCFKYVKNTNILLTFIGTSNENFLLCELNISLLWIGFEIPFRILSNTVTSIVSYSKVVLRYPSQNEKIQQMYNT